MCFDVTNFKLRCMPSVKLVCGLLIMECVLLEFETEPVWCVMSGYHMPFRSFSSFKDHLLQRKLEELEIIHQSMYKQLIEREDLTTNQILELLIVQITLCSWVGPFSFHIWGGPRFNIRARLMCQVWRHEQN